ncbi:MAG: Hsp20/alpha crystallin family protein, partial [Moorea sp. SIO2B7]|nr:Hsp20/alpha crystallin family protein [Moorena sp. SIO2B7]
MTLIRFSPISEFESIRNQLDRIFDEFGSLSKSNYQTTWKPAVELLDNNESLILKASLPGIEAKDLDISVTRESVKIAGENHYENKSQENGYYHSEFHYGKFKRTISLPVPVQNDKVEAEYKNGILTLTLPKVEEVVNR